MVDREALLYPTVSDRDGLDEYLQDLADLLPVIERGVARLKRAPTDREIISDIFRALHNLKGDASICQVELGVLLVHPVETLFSRMRAGEIIFSEVLAEVVLLTLDRLEMALDALAEDRSIAHLRLPILADGLDALAQASGLMLETTALQLIEDVTGFRPAAIGRTFKAGTSSTPGRGGSRSAEHVSSDLHFFMELSALLDARSPLFKGRSGRLLRLAQETNTAAGKLVNPVQLEAAIYMHDIGMMFIPEASWLKPGKLSADELKLLHAHPGHGAGLLARMPGWEEAARMVREHHEMPDGKGYPAGLKNGQICEGAKIIAIVDAFESITTKHAQRGQGRSVLRAIAEINASDKQFDPVWIQHFNGVVRKRLEAA
ncbi:MAG TPA: HD domain-containing phosphohydrolase [Rhodocyclaceae bacterium]|nr:HD domain-containing phosphohydrolase [Rhodocyclaceae bacterium]